jgi:hypothetical protein
MEEAFRQPGDCDVSRRIPQLAVLTRRTDQTLLLPIAQDTRSDSDLLGKPRNRDEFVIGPLEWLPVSR